MFKKIFWDSESSSIKGSFVNLAQTVVITVLTAYGILFSDLVVARIEKLSTFIVTFFGASFGIWAAKAHMDKRIDQNGNNKK